MGHLMSKFVDKIQQSILPSEKDWMDYLIQAHQNAPSMTPLAFADHVTKEGLNSYALLAQACSPFKGQNCTVVDLACGDGYLISYLLEALGSQSKVIGIDISDAELSIAKQRFSAKANVSFIQTEAQNLTLIDQSVDLVFCHMALMLMLPIEPVIHQISRVLKSGGLFSAVVGRSAESGSFFSLVQGLSSEMVRSRFPNVKDVKSGDQRVFSEEGLRSLFKSDTAFSELQDVQEFDLQYNVVPADVWQLMKNMYFISMLPPSDQERLQDATAELASRHVGSNGKVEFTFPMRKFTVTKK